MIEVLKKGLYTSIQDLGRVGFRKYGVPVTGAMDSDSAELANLILGNDVQSATMEITLQGPKLGFLVPTKMALSGADLSPKLNGKRIELNQMISIRKGDILEFGKRKFGARCYLAVAGGFKTEQVLGSKSFYQGITPKTTVENGDLIAYHSGFAVIKSSFKKVKLPDWSFQKQALKTSKGPEFEMLSEAQKRQLFEGKFTIGINNRMGYQLRESIDNQLNPILSSAVLPGTVQLTPSGKLIILMRDCQTTGGYPRVLQLTESGINLLAQKVQGEVVRFQIL